MKRFLSVISAAVLCLGTIFAPSPSEAASANNLTTVQKIYIGYYHRPADPGGLVWWAGELDRQGGNLNAIIEAFANSAESQALYGTINSSNIATIVNDIYLALFNRDADSGGLNYYVTEFNKGRFTAATIMLNILFGAQDQDLTTLNNKVAAADRFTRTIDPDLDGTGFQATYEGYGDVIAGRNFLSLYATEKQVPSEAETSAYVKNNIADQGDPIKSSATKGQWIDLPMNSQKTFTTSAAVEGLPSSLANKGYSAVVRMANLVPGKRYEVTFSYPLGPSIWYGHCWIDGNPFGQDWYSFVGIGSGTGSDNPRTYTQKYLFTVDQASTSSAMYWTLDTDKPMTVTFGITDQLSGVNEDSRDEWGYYYVDELDYGGSRTYLLQR